MCPGCSLDKREREKKEQLEQRAASKNTTPVKLAADAVKLPEEGEEEEDEEEEEEEEDNNAEDSEAKTGEIGKQGKQEKPREGGDAGSKPEAASSAGNGGKSDALANEKDPRVGQVESQELSPR